MTTLSLGGSPLTASTSSAESSASSSSGPALDSTCKHPDAADFKTRFLSDILDVVERWVEIPTSSQLLYHWLGELVTTAEWHHQEATSLPEPSSSTTSALAALLSPPTTAAAATATPATPTTTITITASAAGATPPALSSSMSMSSSSELYASVGSRVSGGSAIRSTLPANCGKAWSPDDQLALKTWADQWSQVSFSDPESQKRSLLNEVERIAAVHHRTSRSILYQLAKLWTGRTDTCAQLRTIVLHELNTMAAVASSSSASSSSAFLHSSLRRKRKRYSSIIDH